MATRDWTTPERREQQRQCYLRMRKDPVKLKRYRERKREWARARKAKPAGEELRPSIPPA